MDRPAVDQPSDAERRESEAILNDLYKVRDDLVAQLEEIGPGHGDPAAGAKAAMKLDLIDALIRKHEKRLDG